MIYRKVEDKHSEIINYKGYLSYQITGELIDKLTKINSELNIKKSTHRKIITLMVEMLENNYQYVNELNEQTLARTKIKPYFLFKKEGNQVRLESGNPVLIKDAEALKKKIDHINHLPYDQLKELYKKTMAEGIYENKKGAGLGIIKMAKITKNPINYSIIDLTEHLCYYTISISLPLKNNV